MCREKKQHITHQLICKLWPHKQNDDEIYLSRILNLHPHSFLFQNVQLCIWGENAHPNSIRRAFIRIYLIIEHFWRPLLKNDVFMIRALNSSLTQILMNASRLCIQVQEYIMNVFGDCIHYSVLVQTYYFSLYISKYNTFRFEELSKVRKHNCCCWWLWW